MSSEKMPLHITVDYLNKELLEKHPIVQLKDKKGGSNKLMLPSAHWDFLDPAPAHQYKTGDEVTLNKGDKGESKLLIIDSMTELTNTLKSSKGLNLQQVSKVKAGKVVGVSAFKASVEKLKAGFKKLGHPDLEKQVHDMSMSINNSIEDQYMPPLPKPVQPDNGWQAQNIAQQAAQVNMLNSLMSNQNSLGMLGGLGMLQSQLAAQKDVEYQQTKKQALMQMQMQMQVHPGMVKGVLTKEQSQSFIDLLKGHPNLLPTEAKVHKEVFSPPEVELDIGEVLDDLEPLSYHDLHSQLGPSQKQKFTEGEEGWKQLLQALRFYAKKPDNVLAGWGVIKDITDEELGLIIGKHVRQLSVAWLTVGKLVKERNEYNKQKG